MHHTKACTDVGHGRVRSRERRGAGDRDADGDGDVLITSNGLSHYVTQALMQYSSESSESSESNPELGGEAAGQELEEAGTGHWEWLKRGKSKE